MHFYFLSWTKTVNSKLLNFETVWVTWFLPVHNNLVTWHTFSAWYRTDGCTAFDFQRQKSLCDCSGDVWCSMHLVAQKCKNEMPLYAATAHEVHTSLSWWYWCDHAESFMIHHSLYAIQDAQVQKWSWQRLWQNNTILYLKVVDPG